MQRWGSLRWEVVGKNRTLLKVALSVLKGNKILYEFEVHANQKTHARNANTNDLFTSSDQSKMLTLLIKQGNT